MGVYAFAYCVCPAYGDIERRSAVAFEMLAVARQLIHRLPSFFMFLILVRDVARKSPKVADHVHSHDCAFDP